MVLRTKSPAISEPVEKIKIAILVPAYRCASTISETLDSIGAQGEILREVVSVTVAEDRGGDATAELARAAWSDPGVDFKVTENSVHRGEYENLNRAILALDPRIEWVIVLNGDHRANPNWLSTLVSRIYDADEKTASICGSWDSEHPDGTVVPGDRRSVSERLLYEGNRHTVRDTLFIGGWWNLSCSAIRVRAFKEVGMFPVEMSHKGDWDFVLRLYGSGWRIEYVPVSLIRHRDNPEADAHRNFSRFRDLRENNLILRRHLWALNLWEVWFLHGRYLEAAVKRSFKAIFWLHWIGAFRGIEATGLIIANLLYCTHALLAGRQEWLRKQPVTAELKSEVDRVFDDEA